MVINTPFNTSDNIPKISLIQWDQLKHPITQNNKSEKPSNQMKII